MNIDRSSKKNWLNGLGRLYGKCLDNPNDEHLAQLYAAEKQAFYSSHPDPVKPPSDIESADYQANIVLEEQRARDYALAHPENLEAQFYARKKLQQKMTTVPREMDVPGNHVCRNDPNDTSEPYIEVCGGGDEPAPREIVE